MSTCSLLCFRLGTVCYLVSIVLLVLSVSSKRWITFPVDANAGLWQVCSHPLDSSSKSGSDAGAITSASLGTTTSHSSHSAPSAENVADEECQYMDIGKVPGFLHAVRSVVIVACLVNVLPLIGFKVMKYDKLVTDKKGIIRVLLCILLAAGLSVTGRTVYDTYAMDHYGEEAKPDDGFRLITANFSLTFVAVALIGASLVNLKYYFSVVFLEFLKCCCRTSVAPTTSSTSETSDMRPLPRSTVSGLTRSMPNLNVSDVPETTEDRFTPVEDNVEDTNREATHFGGNSIIFTVPVPVYDDLPACPPSYEDLPPRSENVSSPPPAYDDVLQRGNVVSFTSRTTTNVSHSISSQEDSWSVGTLSSTSSNLTTTEHLAPPSSDVQLPDTVPLNDSSNFVPPPTTDPPPAYVQVTNEISPQPSGDYNPPPPYRESEA